MSDTLKTLSAPQAVKDRIEAIDASGNLTVLAKILNASRRGKFKLSSGAESDFYFDGRKVTLDPAVAFRIAKCVASYVYGLNRNVTAVGGPSTAAIPIAAGLVASKEFHVKGFYTRSEPKAHGTGQQIEGMNLDGSDRVVLVDDTLTSGKSLLTSIAAVRATGAEIVGAWVLLDREEGGAEALAKEGVKVVSFVNKATIMHMLEVSSALSSP